MQNCNFLPVLCGFEMLSVTLRVSDDRTLRKTIGHQREEVTGQCRT